MSETPWYKEGLSFKCTACGKCCTGAPGYVWVGPEEMEAMAEFLKLSLQEFTRKYIRRVGQRFSLVESKVTYDCVFLKEGKCSVYGARPTQCRTYPWWPDNLSSPQAWQETAQRCEGITPDAPVVPFEEIKEQVLIQLGGHEKTR